MNHYADFDPYLIRERNEQIRREVKALQLGKQLRKRRNPHGLRMTALGEWLRALIGGAKLAQQPSPQSGARVDEAAFGKRFRRVDGASRLYDAAPAAIRNGTRR
jgi:hypothetical protein